MHFFLFTGEFSEILEFETTRSHPNKFQQIYPRLIFNFSHALKLPAA